MTSRFYVVKAFCPHKSKQMRADATTKAHQKEGKVEGDQQCTVP